MLTCGRALGLTNVYPNPRQYQSWESGRPVSVRLDSWTQESVPALDGAFPLSKRARSPLAGLTNPHRSSRSSGHHPSRQTLSAGKDLAS